MFLPPPEPTAAVERIYESNQASQGFVMNLTSGWAWRPDVFDSFAALRGQLTSSSSLSKRDQAVLVCATASQLQDSYCSLAWGKTLVAEAGATATAAVLTGGDEAALTARDRALAAWARKVVADPNSTTPPMWPRCAARGWTIARSSRRRRSWRSGSRSPPSTMRWARIPTGSVRADAEKFLLLAAPNLVECVAFAGPQTAGSS